MENGRPAGGEETGNGHRKNWGEDSRAERHPDGADHADHADGADHQPVSPAAPARRDEEDLVDLESEESFPASDAPAFTPGKVR